MNTVVIGDGWSALSAVGYLAGNGDHITWISASGARMLAPLPTLESGAAVDAWKALADQLSISCSDSEEGSFLREYRNKSFRETAWTKAPDPDSRRVVRDELLWSVERPIAPAFESRFDLSAGELEERIRAQVLQLPNVERIEAVPVSGIKVEDGFIRGVSLANGVDLSCDRVVYADRWTQLSAIEGMPKAISFTKHRGPLGVLQAIFTHKNPMTTGLQHGFYGALHKEVGEEFQRNLWGYFLDSGARSVWTLFLNANEVEDNHEIAKKLRRMKQALDRMFTGGEWLPNGTADFMSNVESEQVRFEENMIFSEGQAPDHTLTIPKISGLVFFTDGYGPSSALTQIAAWVKEVSTAREAASNAESEAAPSEEASPN